MPVRRLPSNPNLDHLKYQAKDLLKEHTARTPGAAQRIREFHPRFGRATDVAIFDSHLSLSGAQLAIAREYGFPSWARLKAHIERPALSDQLNLPHHERIEDATFRRAVELLDRGDVAGLRAHLHQHPNLVHQHVTFEGGNYFRNPTLLEFVAENPVRHGILPDNIVRVANVILDAGGEPALNETLMLVSTGSVPRECGMQLPLIHLLCDYGADPNSAIHATALHGELEALNALIGRGGRIDLPVADASRRPAGCFRVPTVRIATWRSRWPRSLVMSRSFACCWTRAKIPIDITRSGAIPIRHRCIRPLGPAIVNSSDFSSNAVRDSI